MKLKLSKKDKKNIEEEVLIVLNRTGYHRLPYSGRVPIIYDDVLCSVMFYKLQHEGYKLEIEVAHGNFLLVQSLLGMKYILDLMRG